MFRMLFVMSLIVLGALAPVGTAQAQVDQEPKHGDSGGPMYVIMSGGVSVGELYITDESPPSTHTANREYWHWASGWPSGDFKLTGGGSGPPSGSATYIYDAEDFPTSATTQLPTSLGQNDRMYAVSECDSSNNCDNVAFLWVVDNGAALKWYMRDDWPNYRIGVGSSSGDYIHFDHLVSAPSTTDSFRYLEHDEL